jgi:hypothetical protein
MIFVFTTNNLCEFTVPPSIDEANIVDSPKVIVNRTVILECPVSGFPPPQVRWLKNGESLEIQPGMTLSSTGRILEISRVQLTDTARYTCVAQNDAGELRRNFDLEVLGENNISFMCTLTCVSPQAFSALNHVTSCEKVV